jgi:protein O-mannosyl-transferase
MVSGSPKSRPRPARTPDWPGLLCGAVLAAGTIAIYSRTFSDPLLFDDHPSISENPSIRRLWPILRVYSPPIHAGVAGRPLLNLSFALNYAFGGTAVAGYHLANLGIHVLAGWTLFALVRLTLLSPPLAARFGRNATLLGLAVAALWAWHPVQTEAVTYISQRAESLMGLFYLLTLYCFARGAQGGGRVWFPLSVAACMAGAATKEVIVTAPVMVFLYDRTFVSGSFPTAWRRHARLYAALAATLLLLAPRVLSLQRGDMLSGVGFGPRVAWWNYGLTECRVVLRYIRLAFWPSPLVFDYGGCVPCLFSETWPYAAALALLLALAAAALRRTPAAGFAACWFFLILGPSSSVIPVVEMPMAESRLYLPLAGVVSLVVLGAFALAGRRILPVLAAVAVALGLASAGRNRDYSSALRIWGDTVEKCPENTRAHNNYGKFLMKVPGQLDSAISQFEEALRIFPDHPDAHYNLGTALMEKPGRAGDAASQFEEAIRLKPAFADAHFNLGNALAIIPGRLDEAISHYEEALRLSPESVDARVNLAIALARTPGRLNDAIPQYEEALRLAPDSAEAHNDFGSVLQMLPGRLGAAVLQYAEAIRLKPDYADAHYNLGNALASIPGRRRDAVLQLEEALRLRPGYAEARRVLGGLEPGAR